MIDKFKGEYEWLSNFYPDPVGIVMDRVRYPSVEHAYQAAKSDDPDYRERILKAPTAKEAKRLGKKAKLRDDWDEVRVDLMKDLIGQKFASGSDLATKLIATRNEMLVEGNWWGDTFWGKCNGVGENHLGKILMEQRKWLISP